jgi:flagellar FliL protein
MAGNEEQSDAPAVPKRGRKKLVIAGAVGGLALVSIGAAYATGVLTGDSHPKPDAAATGGGMVVLPEMIANLNAGPRRNVFVRLKAQLQLSNKADEANVIADQARVQDLFQTYLRDMSPDELRGSAGSYRLREELIARANIAVAPAQVTDILFVEMLVQ